MKAELNRPAEAHPARRWRRPQRLSTQLALFTAAVLIVTIVGFAWLNAKRQTEDALHATKVQAEVLANNLAAASTGYVINNDLASLEQLLLQAAEFSGIKRVQISDRSGQLLSHVDGSGEAGSRIRFDIKRINPPDNVSAQVSMSEAQLVAWQPIISGNLLGWVRVEYSLDTIQQVRARIWRNTLLVALVGISLSVAFLMFFLRPTLTAIRRASDFAENLAMARGEQVPFEHGPREVEKLIQALNFASNRLHEQERAISASTDHLQAILTNVADGIITVDEHGKITSFNPAAVGIFGYTPDEIIGQPFTQLLLPSTRATQIGAFGLHDPDAAIALGTREAVGVRKSGIAFPIDLSVSKMVLDNHVLRVAVVRDITDRIRAQELASRMGRILDHSSNEIYVFGVQDLRFIQVNNGALRNLGFTLDEIREMTPLDIKPEFKRDQFLSLLERLHTGQQEQLVFETVHRRKDESTYPVEVRLQLSHSETPPVYVAIVQDVSERKQTQERLNYMAHYDALTGLPNRVLFNERLSLTMQDANIKERLVALMFIDLDRFKNINDTLGHDAGDELLKAAARRLTGCLRRGDTVARLGGDEFTVVLADVGHVDDVAWVANKILEAFSRPFYVADSELFVSASIGITLYPFDDPGIDGLLKNADMAMYKAKEQGRNNYQFYTAEMNARAREHLGLETAMRRALEREEFLVHFQPQVDLRSGRIMGLEALLRWHHPQRGLVPPGAFIPLAEENGLIVPIGEWVLRACCAQLRAWEAIGLNSMRVAVNLSPRQFRQKDLPQLVESILNETRLSSEHLELEITEGSLMQNADTTIATLATLKSMGVRLSIDDFGTGYSSLSYLKRFPIDTLKIDQSFVRDITHGPDEAAITTAIITMAHSLGMQVVAEGVETTDELKFLLQHDCDGIQGFLFCRPLAAAELTELLRSGRRLDLESANDPAETGGRRAGH